MNENVFENELLNGEEILWTGQPNKSKIFTKSDILLIPFSII